jgi:CRP-like cAMP-binding protein
MSYRKDIFGSGVSPLAKIVYVWLSESGGGSISNKEIGSVFGRTDVHVSNVLGELGREGYIRAVGTKRGRVIEVL